MEANQNELVTRLIVKYGPGTGMRHHIEEEVVHLSLQLVTHADSRDIVESQDLFEPHCFHHSRRRGLELAISRQSEIAALGFGGPAVALRIPAIPFAQEQDAGLHISLYNQPKQDMVHYRPPDIDECRARAGQEFTFVLDGALKVLNGSEQNDLKVGGCYYVSLGCGSEATRIVNEIKSSVGLPPDATQEFHLSLATIAPVWWPCHPKSAVALQATSEQKSIWQEVVRTFRHGDCDTGFTGFNDDATTGWTSHTAKMAEAGKFNAEIAAKIKNLAAHDVEELEELQHQLIDVPKTLGFCKTVGSRETILKINTPSTGSQFALNQKFDPGIQ